jgi:hypothetical protein
MYFFAPSGFQFQALQQAGQNFAAHGGKLSQLGPLLGRGGQYNLQVDSDLEGYGYTFYQDVANFDVGVFLNGYFNGSSIGYAEMLAVGEAYAAGLVNGVPSSNWSPAQTVQWAQWWTAGWNAAQTGNYPGQLGPLRSGREPIVSAKMSNHAGMKHTVIIIAAACSVGSSYAAVSDPTVLGAMQAFQDFCLSSDLSVEAIADLAKDRHYKLIVDRRLPGPSGSIIVNNTWQATDITGNFALTVTQADGLRSTFPVWGVAAKGHRNKRRIGIDRPITFWRSRSGQCQFGR